METEPKERIAVIGGTGKEGRGLGFRWSRAGFPVIIGSRQAEKAVTFANELSELVGPGAHIEGYENARAALEADVVVVTVPYTAHADILAGIREAVQGKLVVDVTVPMEAGHITRVYVPPDGSAALEAKRILGDGVKLASAFQNVPYSRLLNEEEIDCDVLVCGIDKETRDRVISLAAAAGLRAWDAGPLENSVVPEGLTSILLGINRRFHIEGAGIRITGVGSGQ